MPLYSNILRSTSEAADSCVDEEAGRQSSQQATKATPSASMRLLQDHLMSKKRLKQASSQAQKLQKLSKPQDVITKSSMLSEFDWDLMDEYDPMAPNSYEILQLEFIKSQEQRRNESRSSSGKIDPSVLDVLDRLDAEEDHLVDNRISRGTAIGPPPTLQMTHAQSNSTSSNDLDTSFTNLPKPSEKLDGTSAAAKIMAKMGYKLGQGLGRDGQGISSPLEVEKSGGSAGRIVQRPKSPSPPEKLPNPESQPTRVLLLQNMVGPGEVDDDLELETKMECAKYGQVVKCLIFELPNKLVPDDQAVRIFIEFKSTESAQNAANDLNGRYFGGRVVKASFYNVDKFNKFELGP